MILYYQNTSSIRFDMFGTTFPGLPAQNSGIFQAWDGNLNLLPGGNTNGFAPLVTVPEPSTSVLAALATLTLATRRRR